MFPGAKMCQFCVLQVPLWQQYGGTAGGGVIDMTCPVIYHISKRIHEVMML